MLLFSLFVPIAIAAPPDYHARGTILIQGNSGFTSTNGVVGGSGTSSDPYVIEGWSISANLSSGISIKNTNAYFVIRGCLITGTYQYAGIYVENASNGRIEGNTVVRCLDGVMLSSSSRIAVANNSLLDCSYGLRVEYSSNNTLSNNTLADNVIGAYFGSSGGNLFAGNTIENSSKGVYLMMSDNNTLSNNRISDAPEGISLSVSNNNAVTGNTVINTTQGISLFFSSNNRVTGNTIVKGPKSINVDNLSSNNTISGNTFLDALPKQNATLSLQVSNASARLGTSITISGTLIPAQPGTVSIYWSINGSPASLLSNESIASGSFSRAFNLSQVGTYSIYAYWAGNDAYNPATSPTVTVTSTAAQVQKTTPTVSISASKTSIALGANQTSEAITISGTISPFVSPTQVNIRVTSPSNQVTTIPVTAASSTFSGNVTISAPGVWTIIAQVPEGAVYNQASSVALTVTASAGQATGGDNTLIYAGAGLAVVAIVLVALLMVMKKKK